MGRTGLIYDTSENHIMNVYCKDKDNRNIQIVYYIQKICFPHGYALAILKLHVYKHWVINK